MEAGMSKKKGEKRAYRCYSREYTTRLGECKETNEAVWPMPEIGDRVVVFQNVIETRNWKTEHGALPCLYKPSDSYFDAFDEPAEYEVKGFTKGRDCPMDPHNYIELYYHSLHGNTGYSSYVKTMLVSIGYLYLYHVDADIHEAIRRQLVLTCEGKVIHQKNTRSELDDIFLPSC